MQILFLAWLRTRTFMWEIFVSIYCVVSCGMLLILLSRNLRNTELRPYCFFFNIRLLEELCSLTKTRMWPDVVVVIFDHRRGEPVFKSTRNQRDLFLWKCLVANNNFSLILRRLLHIDEKVKLIPNQLKTATECVAYFLCSH